MKVKETEKVTVKVKAKVKEMVLILRLSMRSLQTAIRNHRTGLFRNMYRKDLM